MKTILVTGSNGMVGNSLKKLVFNKQTNNLNFTKNYNWIWLTRQDLDLTDYNSVYKYISNFDHNSTIVINLAANVGGLFKNLDNNLEMFESNIRININILETCRKCKIRKVINILSTCIFPNQVIYPLIESTINDGPPHNSNSGYSYSKRIGQIYTNLINESSDNYNYINLIPTNLYGIYDNYNIENAHVIPAIIHKCILIIKNNIDQGSLLNNTLLLPGDGTAERMFLYDEDLCNIIIDLACFKETRGDYIVSGEINNSITINTLANLISDIVLDITGNKINILFEDDVQNNGQLKKPCSNEKLKNLYDEWGENIPINDTCLEQNLKKIIRFFWENYNEYPRK